MDRPPVDPARAAAFARPTGVDGSFDRTSSGADAVVPGGGVRSEDPVHRRAFGRPDPEAESLQRDPLDDPEGEPPGGDDPPEDEDPWRDPESPVHRGPGVDPAPEPEREPGAKLGIRDVLLGGRVSARALAVLAAIALGIGGVGGIAGAWGTDATRFLTSRHVTIAGPDTSAAERSGDHIAKVVAEVRPATVNIRVKTPTADGVGSGAVIHGDGYIVTNNHVISAAAASPGNSTISVRFHDGQSVPARIVGREPSSDVAVIKVDGVDNLTVMTPGDSEALAVGETVIAVGSPLRLSDTVTTGIVSALHRPVTVDGEGADGMVVIDAVQTDAAINQGNSGGPLVDARGRLVGINTLIMSESGGSIGLGFAIPVNDVMPTAEALIRDGFVKYPTIGVESRTAQSERESGARIANVTRGGPADRAGVREGDVVIRLGERIVESSEGLVIAVRRAEPDREVGMVVLREGRRVDLTVTPTPG